VAAQQKNVSSPGP